MSVFSYKASVSLKEIFNSLLFLQMPGTSTWYLKIQILLYLFTLLAFVAFPLKLRNNIIIILVIGYAFVAKYNDLADFWWKTVLCYSAGSYFAEYKGWFEGKIMQKKMRSLLILLVLMFFSYLWIMKDGKYIIIPQLLAFAFLGAGITLISSIFQVTSKMLAQIGRCSFPIYLTHIGLASEVLGAWHQNINLQVQIFVVLTIILSIIIYAFDKKLIFLKTKIVKDRC